MSIRQAVIYGSNGGIGSAIARKFLKENFNLCLFSKNEQKLKENINRFKQTSDLIVNGCPVDVVNLKSIESSVNYLSKNQLPISHLIICTGISDDKLIVRESESNISNIIQTNLISSINICKHYARLMVKQKNLKKEASITLIGSVVGLIGNVGQTTYASSKSALNGLTKSLSKELIGRNIRTNLVMPGFIDTPMLDGLDKEKLIKGIPLNRLGRAEDVANAVHFLATNKSMNGQLLVIDGGLSLTNQP